MLYITHASYTTAEDGHDTLILTRFQRSVFTEAGISELPTEKRKRELTSEWRWTTVSVKHRILNEPQVVENITNGQLKS